MKTETRQPTRAKVNHKEGTLLHSLLTENRFWTFWMPDFTKKVYIQWGGKTKFKQVIKEARKHLGIKGFGEICYERQVQIKQPELTFQ